MTILELDTGHNTINAFFFHNRIDLFQHQCYSLLKNKQQVCREVYVYIQSYGK